MKKNSKLIWGLLIISVFAVAILIVILSISNVSSHDLLRDVTKENGSGEYECLSGDYVVVESFYITRDASSDFVRQLYDAIDFHGEFTRLEPKLYEFYVKKFYEIINLERSFFVGESLWYLDSFDEQSGYFYLRDGYDPNRFIYYFFDFNGSGVPDLGINTGNVVHIISYCKELDVFELIYGVSWRERILGPNRIARIGGTWNFTYIELGYNNEPELVVSFRMGGNYGDNEDEEYLFFLGVPNGIEISENMRNEFISRLDGHYYLEVTKDEWNDLVGDFFLALELSEERMHSISFSYEGLFRVVSGNDAMGC